MGRVTLTLRKAETADIDFLVKIDLKDEGVAVSHMADYGAEEFAQHRDKIAAFVLDDDKDAWVFENAETGRMVGIILWRFRNRLREKFETWSIFDQMDEALFPADGAFCEMFQLWVAPDYRRRGLATRLKKQAEAESRRRGVKLIYTHTEEQNSHVIELNRKLGYVEARRGPIWDAVIRVSLIKRID